MNKGIRLIKRLVALFLVLLFSIESFAAVVGDNDGGAFITKAEFDSLKSDFQNQINQYNMSIDSKIDGAIANYLAGVTIPKANVLSFPLNQITYVSADTINMDEGLMGVQFYGTQSISVRDRRSAKNGGLNGHYICNVPAVPAAGIILDTRCDGLYHKGGIVLGLGTVTHESNYFSFANHNTYQNDASALNSRMRRWALNWWNADRNLYAVAISDSRSYYDYFCIDFDKTTAMSWRPFLLAVQNGAAAVVGSEARANIGSSLRKYDIRDDSLLLFNDQVLENCIDANYVNGIAMKAVDNSVGTLDVLMYAMTNANDSDYNTATKNNLHYNLIYGYGWSGDNWFNAYLAVTTWNTVVQTGDYYKYFNGKNHLMFTSYISQPRAIYTKAYASTHFDLWLRSQDTNLWLDYDGNTYFNLRYGNLLYDADKTAGKYKLKVRNDSGNSIGFKILTNLSTTNFNQAQGIITDKSDTTDKNKIVIGPNSDITINFEIELDVPIFFKCSDGAKISLISMTQTVET